MLKIMITGILCFIVGYGVGQYSSDKASFIHDKETNSTEHMEIGKSLKQELNLQDNTHKKVKTTDKKAIAKHKYFKKKNNSIGKAEALLNKAARMDRQVFDGEPNMDLIDLYEEVLALDPNNTRALSYYSNYMIQLGRYDEAKSLVDRCLTIDPDHPSCLGDSTVFLLNGGKRDDIDKNIDNCLARTPLNVRCLHNKGQSLMSKGEPAEALIYFQKLEESNGAYHFTFPKSIIYLSYAQAYEKMNNKVKAKQYYEDACSEGQEFACKWSKEQARL